MLPKLIKDLNAFSDPSKAKILSRFFKTGKGEYGEGDVFLGINVPTQRQIAEKYVNLPLKEVRQLLESKIHEHRLVALMILQMQYKKASKEIKKQIFDFYIKYKKYINNWDLIDLSSQYIVGNYLLDKDRTTLYRLAKSDVVWDRRIAIISTAAFIRENDFTDTIKISTLLLKDKHDLIQKAVGWMLREVGKRDLGTLENFLKKNYKTMPRTMLKYAIERFEERRRRWYIETSRQKRTE